MADRTARQIAPPRTTRAHRALSAALQTQRQEHGDDPRSSEQHESAGRRSDLTPFRPRPGVPTDVATPGDSPTRTGRPGATASRNPSDQEKAVVER